MEMLTMDCDYSDYFGKQATNGYEALIYDCLLGNCLLFARADNVETNWSTVDPILKFWQASNSGTMQTYAAGTSGPMDANELLERDGRKWRAL
jgi:glucose-6-phosphate 1-dehydrogenase